ncbi:hypothetical protein GCM10007919_67050 [Rhizobium indigoferae]|nr:hypothetical protein GCM10007919_67050 [Rhizobium indigoferae]
MHSIAKRIEDCAQLVIDGVGKRHDIKGWQAKILRKSSRYVDTDSLCLRIQMEPSSPSSSTVQADDMAFAGDSLADCKVTDIGA